jgi:uncharacterized protein YhaN
MKILELQLIAYGPFSDAAIDLSAGSEGLHIVYGPNEAGKSSALRALHALLYGVPERSGDDFRHPYAKMRIGAAIQSSNGELLKLVRRKGRSNTLRADDDQTVLDESVLQRFISGVGADLFTTMFGIGYDSLVRGGREIIRGGGSVGQILFAAGSGIANLREVQAQLQAEADALFKPSGQKPSINAAISRFNSKRKALRDAQLPGQQWQRHDRALREATARKQSLEQALAGEQRDVHRLKRIREALPIIAQRTELMHELQDYASAALLPEHFGEKRRELITNLQIAENDRTKALDAIETIEKAAGELQVSEITLENAGLIEELYQELGSQNKAAKDRVRLETRRSVLRGEAADILRSLRDDLTLEEAGKLRIKKTETVRINELGTRYERIVTRIESNRQQIPQLAHDLENLKKELKDLKEPKPVDALKDAMAQAEEFGALEKHCRAEQREVQRALKNLEVTLGQQTLWPGTVAALESLPVPLAETIDVFEDRVDAAERRVADLKAEIARVEGERREVDRQLEALQIEHAVPTEQDLLAARHLRDDGWQLVRSRLADAPASEEAVNDFVRNFPASENLAAAFGSSVKRADEVADRLRREADRVAAKAKLLTDRDVRTKQQAQLETDLAAAEKRFAETLQEWIRLWEPVDIVPRTPREMRVWAQNHRSLTAKAAEIRERKAKAEDLRNNIDAQRRSLDQCLLTLSGFPAGEIETLSDLIKRSRKVVESQEHLGRKREQLLAAIAQRENELTTAQTRVTDSEKDLSQWQSRWAQAVSPLGLDANAFPAQANVVVEELKTLFDKLNEAAILQKRMAGIDRDADAFASNVLALVKAAAVDLAGMPADQAAVELNRRLNRIRTAASKKKTLDKQVKTEKKRKKKAVGTLTDIQSQLDSMCREAGCDNHQELAEAERRSEQRRRIESELAGLDDHLRKLSAGATVDEFIKDALKEDPDAINAQLQRLEESIRDLTREKSDLDQTIGSERTELGKMDGSAQAAELAEDTQMLLGRIESDVEKYAGLKLATAVLNLAMERYRAKNQGPILARADLLFSQLTQESFAGLRLEFDDHGQPVLVGVRPGGKEIVTVDGMSDGTADQLYLALRLAGVAEYLAQNEPMPFIVDDILIKFDDGRAVAALKALADLSKTTQVIFFTHHRHLVELAEEHLGSSLLINHKLA